MTWVSIAEGSKAGGAVLEILGTGFAEKPEHNRVTIQGRPCGITAASMERLLCLAPAEGAPSTEGAPAAAVVAGDMTAAAVAVDDSDCGEQPGMVSMAGAQSIGGSFTADRGMSKGRAWLRYKPVVAVTNVYEVLLQIPGTTSAGGEACLPRAGNVLSTYASRRKPIPSNPGLGGCHMQLIWLWDTVNEQLPSNKTSKQQRKMAMSHQIPM